MKIILDTDGTMTDFNKYIFNNAIPYFQKKYGMVVKKPDALEVEDIFDMDNFFAEKYNITIDEAKKYTKKALDKFWISHRFIKFSLLEKFRPALKEYVVDMLKKGHTIQVHTSRSKTSQNNVIGFIARTFTIWQYRLNGIKLSKKDFYFYKNDESKIEGIKKQHPDLVLDDKPEIINSLSNSNIKCVCTSGNHNSLVTDSEMIQKVDSSTENDLQSKIILLLGAKNVKFYDRAAQSDVVYKRLKILRPLISFYFKPIILHKENLIDIDDEAIIYAPNHRSTLDPIAIMGVIIKNIHWAALLRFFKGTDSIFNNSKNPILCKITSKTFKSLEYFPIERKMDNPHANNLNSVRDMVGFLKIRQQIGIFPEGTTRRPEGQEFGTFDDSFLTLAKKTNAWVQPITTLWIKDLKIGPKLIINFGQPFKVERHSISEAMERYISIQQESLEENYSVKKALIKEKK